MTFLVEHNKWPTLSPEERVRHVLGRSLDECKELLDIPWIELGQLRSGNSMIQAKTQVIRAVLMITAKIGLESERLNARREETLQHVIDDFAEFDREGKGSLND